MRPTNDKKDFNLRVRLNDRMYAHLAKMSEIKKTSFSGYIRDLIQKDISDGNNRNHNSDFNSGNNGR